MDTSGNNAPPLVSCHAPGSSARPPALSSCSGNHLPPDTATYTDCATVTDIGSARRWLQDHAHAECKDRGDLLELCDLLQKGPERGHKEQLAQSSGIKRRFKNEQGQWRNRSLSDIKSDAKIALIRRVNDPAEAHNTSAASDLHVASSSSGAPSPSIDEAQPPAATKPNKNASSAVSPARQASKRGHGTKPLASNPVERNADTTASSSERATWQHATEDTASGAKASALKRKSSASASSASGAIPPTQRQRTSEADDTLEANETRLTIEQWSELHEFLHGSRRQRQSVHVRIN